MGAAEDRSLPAAPLIETERLVGWLRLPAIALIGFGHGLQNPEESSFYVALGLFGAWSVGVLFWLYARTPSPRFALVTTAADIGAITALVFLSGGAFSEARTAYFLVPVAVAFRFRPSLTALAGGAAVLAYLIQAAVDNSSRPDATRLVAVHTGYLIWITAAAALLSYLLARRTRRIEELATVSRRLAADALVAEERERQALADGLHDSAIQTLLSARHDVEEAEASVSHPSLARADAALGQTVAELREALFELHPYVLTEAGLETALGTIGQRVARRAGFTLRLDVQYSTRHPHERLILAVARELLINVGKHASARNVTVRLAEDGGALSFCVTDDGSGFDPGELGERLAEGHIGLAAQRLRVESAGGTFDVRSAPEWGTTVELRLPLV